MMNQRGNYSLQRSTSMSGRKKTNTPGASERAVPSRGLQRSWSWSSNKKQVKKGELNLKTTSERDPVRGVRKSNSWHSSSKRCKDQKGSWLKRISGKLTRSKKSTIPTTVEFPTPDSSHRGSEEEVESTENMLSDSSLSSDDIYMENEEQEAKDISQQAPVKPVSILKRQSKYIRFADEAGKPICQVQHHDTAMPPLTKIRETFHRLVVLLMDVKNRSYEFIRFEYSSRDKTKVGDLIMQLSDTATDGQLAAQRYIGLCRIIDQGKELSAMLSIKGYELNQDEVLVAVPSGYQGSQVVRLGLSLLQKQTIALALGVALNSDTNVNRIKTHRQLKREQEEEREKELERSRELKMHIEAIKRLLKATDTPSIAPIENVLEQVENWEESSRFASI